MIRIDTPQSGVRPSDERPAAPGGAAPRTAGEDRYTSSRPDAPVTYSRPVGGSAGPGFEPLREYVVSLLRQQGIATDQLAASPEEAAAAIADDGYWGIEQTSERIFQFAVGAIGDDLGRLEKVRAAITRGYEEARAQLGGWLPEISERTIERVGEKLDAWVQQHRERTAAAL